MNISFTTILNTLFFSTIAIVLFSFMIDRARVISEKSFLFISFIIIMIMLRMFMPCEILWVQHNVYLTKVYPSVYIFFTRPFLNFLGKEWSVLSVLTIISLTGSIIYTIYFFRSYLKVFHTLKRYGITENEMIRGLFHKINREWRKNKDFQIVQSDEITTPFIFGLRKPIIALPDISLSEAEWYYVLCHEMAHYYHGDLLIRLVCEVLHIVYWWNPFIYLLRRRLIVFQERHIDVVITSGLDEARKMDYLSCLIKVARLQGAVHSDNWIAEFNHNTELQDRIKRFLDSQEERAAGKRHRTVNIQIIFLLVIFTLIFSNLITFEPYHIPEEILHNYFMMNNENSYLILNEEGKYEVYLNDEYKCTVTQIFDDTLSVYNREGELIK